MSEHLLPPNRTKLESAFANTAQLGGVPVPVDTLWNPWQCPASLLPWLAWALSVDVWDSRWPENTQRAVIAASIPVHRTKGTPGGVLRALSALQLPIRMIDWRDYGGAPHALRVEVDLQGQGAQIQTWSLLQTLIHEYKNARSYLDVLRLKLERQVSLPNFAIATRSAERVTLTPRPVTQLRGVVTTQVAASAITLEYITIYPRRSTHQILIARIHTQPIVLEVERSTVTPRLN